MEDKPIPFSTTLSRDTKELLDRFCKRRGVKQNHFVEQAILERLEDEMDLELIRERDTDELIEWQDAG